MTWPVSMTLTSVVLKAIWIAEPRVPSVRRGKKL